MNDSPTTNDATTEASIASRAGVLLERQLLVIHRRTDRLFACLMLFQWAAAIFLAIWLTPLSWAGTRSATHIHVWAALLLGGVLTIAPISLALLRPGARLTRNVIAVAQMLMSGLLIHLTGGRIETHFHVFGSLAFLAFYRDWTVLIPATLVIGADHVLRGLFWPDSVFGVSSAPLWRPLEHAGWVLFEDVFLTISIIQSQRDMRAAADQQARLEATNELIEAKVAERTEELRDANALMQQHSTQRLRAEEHLRASEQRFRSIVETAADGILTFDSTGAIEAFNRAAEYMFHCTADEARLTNALSLITRNDVAIVDDLVCALLRPPNARAAEGFVGRRSDGTTIPLDITLSESSDRGRPVFTAIVRDLTSFAKLQCELAQAQKLESVGQLAAGIAHEINTPIQYVGDNAHFLASAFEDLAKVVRAAQRVLSRQPDHPVAEEDDNGPLGEGVDYLLSEIPQALIQSLDGIEQVATLVRAMKGFSHPGTTEKTDVQLDEAIRMTATVARNEWKYVADLTTDFDPALTTVRCLPGELNQVLLNLIVNSAHAIGDALRGREGDKGQISIRTRRDGPWAEIRIKDTGAGIPAHVRQRVFDPFFTTKEVGKGTGQGLAIARSVVVDKHGGTITFESEEGVGTEFVIRLPLEEHSDAALGLDNEDAHLVC